MSHALFPGTFDPPTLGHLDLVRRAVQLFNRVSVGIASHPTKQAMFTAEEREGLLRESCAGIPNAERVHIVRVDGLVVRACDDLGCDVILRGVRHGGDFSYEAQMAGTNRAMAGHLDTLLMCTSPEHGHITGTLVRQIARMGGDTSALVPQAVQAALEERFRS